MIICSQIDISLEKLKGYNNLFGIQIDQGAMSGLRVKPRAKVGFESI